MGICFSSKRHINKYREPLLTASSYQRPYSTRTITTTSVERMQQVYQGNACGVCEKQTGDLAPLQKSSIASIRTTMFCAKCRASLE